MPPAATRIRVLLLPLPTRADAERMSDVSTGKIRVGRDVLPQAADERIVGPAIVAHARIRPSASVTARI